MWDQRQYYVLSEVYWRTGHALFGKDWTGYETTYRPACNLAELRKKHRDATIAVDRNRDLALRLSRNRPDHLTETEYQEYQAEIDTAEAKAAAARLERDQLSDALQVPEQNQANYDRRVSVECRLVQAFREGDLKLNFGSGQQVDWNEWAKQRTFRISFPQALIYAPLRISNRRRDTGFVLRNDLDEWLSRKVTVEAALVKREGAQEYVEMQKWFADCIERSSAKPRKADVEQEFLNAFQPLGKTTFLDLWKSQAPKSWQKRGPVTS